MSNTADNNVPFHVAIIPDGNRRWARSRGLKPWKGHEEGARNIEELIKKAFDLGIRCLSFWGSSVDNLKKRPLEEKRALLGIYERYFQDLIGSEEIRKNEARINIIGKWREQFPTKLKKILEEGIEKTKHYRKYILNFFLAYNGDDEMLDAIRKIVKNAVAPGEVTPELVKANLMTSQLPPVDYLVRTGGEPHLSAGFMMWDVADSQLYFSDKNFPDFKQEDFEESIMEYQRRGRRHGG